MMSKHPLSSLIIRGAAVRSSSVGYILACDPKKENNDIQHTISFTWKSGKFNRGEANFSAHSCCVVQRPEPSLVKVSGSGAYSAETKDGVVCGNIFRNSKPAHKKPRYGDITSVSEIDGSAYAVGLEGMVYRLDSLTTWTRIDDGLPTIFDIEAIHGFGEADLYAVGSHGQIWRFNARAWKKVEILTKGNLSAVKCAGSGTIYIGGHDGLLITGKKNALKIIKQQDVTDDILDLEWFEDELYISTLSGIYRLCDKGRLVAVDFGGNRPKTTHQLSAAKGVLWSIGSRDIMSCDGKRWSKVV